jgi:NADPH:quinone reductase-like Zn-dependent oxidoreductase
VVTRFSVTRELGIWDITTLRFGIGAGMSITGKRVLITGGSSGIGLDRYQPVSGA